MSRFDNFLKKVSEKKAKKKIDSELVDGGMLQGVDVVADAPEIKNITLPDTEITADAPITKNITLPNIDVVAPAPTVNKVLPDIEVVAKKTNKSSGIADMVQPRAPMRIQEQALNYDMYGGMLPDVEVVADAPATPLQEVVVTANKPRYSQRGISPATIAPKSQMPPRLSPIAVDNNTYKGEDIPNTDVVAKKIDKRQGVSPVSLVDNATIPSTINNPKNYDIDGGMLQGIDIVANAPAKDVVLPNTEIVGKKINKQSGIENMVQGHEAKDKLTPIDIQRQIDTASKDSVPAQAKIDNVTSNVDALPANSKDIQDTSTIDKLKRVAESNPHLTAYELYEQAFKRPEFNKNDEKYLKTQKNMGLLADIAQLITEGATGTAGATINKRDNTITDIVAAKQDKIFDDYKKRQNDYDIGAYQAKLAALKQDREDSNNAFDRDYKKERLAQEKANWEEDYKLKVADLSNKLKEGEITSKQADDKAKELARHNKMMEGIGWTNANTAKTNAAREKDAKDNNDYLPIGNDLVPIPKIKSKAIYSQIYQLMKRDKNLKGSEIENNSLQWGEGGDVDSKMMNIVRRRMQDSPEAMKYASEMLGISLPEEASEGLPFSAPWGASNKWDKYKK